MSDIKCIRYYLNVCAIYKIYAKKIPTGKFLYKEIPARFLQSDRKLSRACAGSSQPLFIKLLWRSISTSAAFRGNTSHPMPSGNVDQIPQVN